MTGIGRTSEGLDERRRRLLFRSWHRGIRETDLILGRFADNFVADFSDADMDAFEKLLEVPDHDVLGWVTGELSPPPHYDTALLGRICAFHRNGAPEAS